MHGANQNIDSLHIIDHDLDQIKLTLNCMLKQEVKTKDENDGNNNNII